MKMYLLYLALLVPAIASPAPFVVSDPSPDTPQPTHCGLLLDAAAKVDVAVAKDAAGKAYCQFDMAGITTGAHTVKATFVLIDPTWGRVESPVSVPLALTRPGSPIAPAGLGLKP